MLQALSLENILKLSPFEFYYNMSKKSSIFSIFDNYSNTFSDNSQSETEWFDFSTLKPFDIEPRKNCRNKYYTQHQCQPKDVLRKQRFGNNSGVNVVGFVSRWKHGKKVCVAGAIKKLQKKIIMAVLCVCVCACVCVFVCIEQHVVKRDNM